MGGGAAHLAPGPGTGFETAGSARALTIPAASLPSGVEISLIVFAYVDGTFSGDYRPYVPYPGMNIRNESNPVTIRRRSAGQHLADLAGQHRPPAR